MAVLSLQHIANSCVARLELDHNTGQQPVNMLTAGGRCRQEWTIPPALCNTASAAQFLESSWASWTLFLKEEGILYGSLDPVPDLLVWLARWLWHRAEEQKDQQFLTCRGRKQLESGKHSPITTTRLHAYMQNPIQLQEPFLSTIIRIKLNVMEHENMQCCTVFKP